MYKIVIFTYILVITRAHVIKFEETKKCADDIPSAETTDINIINDKLSSDDPIIETLRPREEFTTFSIPNNKQFDELWDNSKYWNLKNEWNNRYGYNFQQWAKEFPYLVDDSLLKSYKDEEFIKNSKNEQFFDDTEVWNIDDKLNIDILKNPDKFKEWYNAHIDHSNDKINVEELTSYDEFDEELYKFLNNDEKFLNNGGKLITNKNIQFTDGDAFINEEELKKLVDTDETLNINPKIKYTHRSYK